MNLAIFPLPLLLFPAGVTQLRIFEPRYVRMIKEAAGDRGFALTGYYENLPNHISNWASWVKIIDFAALPDGFFSINIQAQHLLNIASVTVEHDNLLRGQTRPASHWTAQPHSPNTLALAAKLEQLYKQTQQLAALYPAPEYDSASWVCQRWLEILPLPMADKARFIDPASFAQAVQLLTVLILQKKA